VFDKAACPILREYIFFKINAVENTNKKEIAYTQPKNQLRAQVSGGLTFKLTGGSTNKIIAL
jgi:hypothetical protein